MSAIERDERLKKLAEPFPADDIKWRIQQSGFSASGSPWAIVIPYVTSRAVQQRLDDVFGFDWQNAQKETSDGKGFLCGISLLINGSWITRWDGAEYTQIEALKGALSGGLKRTGVLFGIGRYLYEVGSFFALCRPASGRGDCKSDEKYVFDKNTQKGFAWKSPELPAWAIPIPDTQIILAKFSACETMSSLQSHFEYSVKYAKANQNQELYQQAIKFKDKQKLLIDEKLTLGMKENFQSVEQWLESQCDSLMLIKNEEAIVAVSKTLKEELQKRCLHQKFDKEPLVKKLENEINKRLNQLGEKA